MTGCYCDYDPAEFYRATMKTARKPHRCHECGGAIQPGEPYEGVAGRWDGHFSAFKTCTRCLELRAYTLAHVPCTCWGHGNMLDDCRETILEYADELPGMMVGFYRRWIAIFRHKRNTNGRPAIES